DGRFDECWIAHVCRETRHIVWASAETDEGRRGNLTLAQTFLHENFGGSEGIKGRSSPRERYARLLQSTYTGKTRITMNFVAITEVVDQRRRSLARSAYGCERLRQTCNCDWYPTPWEVQSLEPGLHLGAVRGRIVQGAFDSAVRRGVGNEHVYLGPPTSKGCTGA